MFEFSLDKISMLSVGEIRDNIATFKMLFQSKINNSPRFDKTTKENLRNAIDSISHSLSVVINVDALDLGEVDNQVISDLIQKSRLLAMPLKLYVTGGSNFNSSSQKVSMLFKNNDMRRLAEINSFLVENGQQSLRFMEDSSRPESSWDIEQVLNANSKIDMIVSTIKKCNFTPYEAMAYIYKLTTENFMYRENKMSPIMARSLVGVLNSDDIVCVGYSRFIKAIIDKLNMPGLQCETFLSTLKPMDEESLNNLRELGIPVFATGHMQNLIKIKDLKYEVRGNYVVDACGDCKTEHFPHGRGFSNFMFPVDDLMAYKDVLFNQTDSPFDAIMQLTEMTIGEIDQKELPIIRDNRANSKPIAVDKLRKCLTRVFKVSNPKLSDKKIRDLVEKNIIYSQEFGMLQFNESAKNPLIVEAYREESKICPGQ